MPAFLFEILASGLMSKLAREGLAKLFPLASQPDRQSETSQIIFRNAAAIFVIEAIWPIWRVNASRVARS
jgi:hypothetical protein